MDLAWRGLRNDGEVQVWDQLSIPNPAPYITSFFGASTDCN